MKPNMKVHAKNLRDERLSMACRCCDLLIEDADRQKGSFILELLCPDCSQVLRMNREAGQKKKHTVTFADYLQAIVFMFPYGLPSEERAKRIREQSLIDAPMILKPKNGARK